MLTIQIIVYTSIWMVFHYKKQRGGCYVSASRRICQKFQEKYPSYQSEKLGFFSFWDTEKKWQTS